MTVFPIEMLRTLSGITRFFDAATRQMTEGLWYGYHIAIEELRKRARGIAQAESCVDSGDTYTSSMSFSLFGAMPVYLNPITLSYGFKVLTTRSVDELLQVEVDELTYRQLYGCIANGDDLKRLYLVVGDTATAVKSFASTDAGNPDDAISSYKRYWLICMAGPLIEDGASAYVTTGLTFSIDPSILELPYLKTRATDSGETEDQNEVLYSGTDYIFWPESHTIEFMPSVAQRLSDSTELFCWETSKINADLYSIVGGNAGIKSWDSMRCDNATAAAAINASGQSKLYSGSLDAHQRGLASAYRMPVADRKYSVIGQIETVGYPISGLTLVTASGGQYSGPVYIDGVVYPVSSNTIGSPFDGSAMPEDLTGSTAYPWVVGRYNVLQYYNDDSDWYQTMWVADPFGGLESTIASIYKVCVVAGLGQILPSGILETVSGTKSIVHFVAESETVGVSRSASSNEGMAKILCYKYDASSDDYPIYHDMDFPEHSASDESSRSVSRVVGTMVFMHPKHKTLILRDENNQDVLYPLDAPMYSRLNAGDVVDVGDVLCENMIVETSDTMPGVKDAICFKYTNKTMSENCIFEIVQANQIAEYGKDYPDMVVEVS